MGLHAYRPLGYSLSNPSVSKNRSATLRGKSPEMERALTRDAQAACDFSLAMSKSSLQKLRCRSFDDLESEIGGFAFEIVDLQFAVLSVVKLRSSVDELHSIAQHAIDQSSQLGSHSLNGNGSPELSSQAAKLRSKIGLLRRRVLAAILNAFVTRLLVGNRPLPMILSPLTRLSGQSRNQETKWCSVFHLLISHPASLRIVIVVVTSIPSIWVRSVPVMRNSSARKANCGAFPFFFFLSRSFRFSCGRLAPCLRSSCC